MTAPPLEPPSLPILYRDEDLVIVHKPSGLLVHRTGLDAHERWFAVQLLRDQLGQHVFPVHRLDKGTSGLLAFALHADAARTLCTAWESHLVTKTYLAVVRGFPPLEGLIDHPLGRLLEDLPPGTDRASVPLETAQTAFTRLRTVELPVQIDRYPSSRYSLVRLEPLTGRRHQLRRHLKHLSHPIIGDANYGKGIHNRYFAQAFGCGRLLLACVHLRLPLPGRETWLELSCPPSEDFQSVLRALGWDSPTPPDWR